MKLSLTFEFAEGSTPADIASKLHFHANLLEGMAGKEAASVKNTSAKKKAAPAPVEEPEEDEAEETEDEEDDDFAPKKAPVKKGASFEDDDDEDDESAEEETEEEEEPAPKKAAKGKAKGKAAPPAPTEEDVNDACKAYAKEHSVAETKALLKKKFKTMSIKEIPAEKYQAVIDAMAV